MGLSDRVAEALTLDVVVDVDHPPVIRLRPPVKLGAGERAFAALANLVLAAAVAAAA